MTEERLRPDTEASIEPARDEDHERRRLRTLAYIEWIKENLARKSA